MLCALLALSLVQDQSPRLRTLLPNGTRIFVEQMASERTFALTLTADSSGLQDRPEDHGRRHLLEHLLMSRKVGDRTIDQEAEANGILLLASTYRDSMQIEVRGMATKFEKGLELLQKLLEPLKVSQESITREISTIEAERRLLSDERKLSDAAWVASYGEFGMDTVGSKEAMEKETPDSLAELFQEQFGAQRLSIVATGPLDLQLATEAIVAWAGMRSPSSEPGESLRRFQPNRIASSDFYGEARAAEMPSWQTLEGAEVLVAACALAARTEGCFLSAAPGISPGLITIGRTHTNNRFGTEIDSLDDEELAAWMEVGKRYAKQWVTSQLSTTWGTASLRGHLLALSADAKPETFLANIEKVGWTGFKRGVSRFTKDFATVVVGDAR
jgi:hypothetical protein